MKTKFQRRWAMGFRLLALANGLWLIAHGLAHAQQGSGAKALLSFSSPATSVPSLASAAAVAPPVTNAPKYLLWESSAEKFAVYAGAIRTNQTSRTVVATNYFPYTNTLTYSVAPISAKGVESTNRCYYPPKPIGELWERSSVDLQTWKDERLLEKYVGAPKTPRQFLLIENRITGWDYSK